MDNGVIKSISDNLHNFKIYDKIMQEMYGYLEPVYNFNYLTESLKSMEYVVKTAIMT